MLIIQLLLILLSISFSIFSGDLYLNSEICLYSYLIILFLEFLSKKNITLIFIFLSAFIFMIIPEGIINHKELILDWGTYNVRKGFSFLVVSSGLIFIGYKLFEKFGNKNFKTKNYLPIKVVVVKKKTLLLLLILYNIVFLLVNLENAIFGLFYGRASAFPFFYSSALYAIAFIIIGITNHLYEGKKIKTLLINLPIIFIFLSIGTRFFLVYIVFIIFFDRLKSLTFKNIIILFIGAFFVLTATNVIKDVRRGGLLTERNPKVEVQDKRINITEFIAGIGSSEGLIRNAAMISDYTNKNGYTYGKSIGFLGIFWIPRAFWPDKPVMLDSWLIQEYYGTQFGEGYSSASSYGGELYMDFGFFFASLLLFFFGILLGKIQLWIDSKHNISVQNYILSGFLYGWIFFGTRSILTSSFMLVYFLIFNNLIFRFLKILGVTKDVSSNNY